MSQGLNRPMSTHFLLVGLLLIAFATPAAAASYRELEQKVTAMDGRLARLEKLLNNQVLLEMVQGLEALKKELQLLRGDSELSLHEIDLLKKRQRELYLDIDQRLQQVEGVAQDAEVAAPNIPKARTVDTPPGQLEVTKSATSSAAQSVDTATAQSPSEVATPLSEQNAYTRAFNLLKEGRYPGAVNSFTAFLSAYPQSPYSGNAQYWLAEANYVSRKFQAAKAEFKKVIDNYPNSPKVPDASLKLGFTHYELAEWDEARKVLIQLGKQYPNSTVARLADERLRRMKQEGH